MLHRLFLMGCAILCLGSTLSAQKARPLANWQPVTLETDTTTLFLEDLYLEPQHVASVETPSWLENNFKSGENVFQLIVTDEPEPLGIVSLTDKDGVTFNLVVKKSRRQAVTFRFDPGRKTYETVHIAGDMNGWDDKATPLQLVNGQWEVTMELNPGRYQYQVVTNGTWMLDPNNDQQIANGIGGINSLMTVGSTDKSETPFFFLEDTTSTSILIGSLQRKGNDPVFVLWNNVLLPFKEGTTLTVNLPDMVQELDNTGVIRVFGYNEAGEGNDLLIPLRNGNAAVSSHQIERQDFHTSIMYFLMVDRFVNGDPSNDKPINDERLDVMTNYMGGDLAGVMQKIQDNYFTEMGFNTLWLSPVFQGPWEAYMEYPPPHRWFAGYHGYWPISLSKVDERLGTNAQYKALVDTLHNRDMNIVLDYIANHVHSEHPLWTEHPDWFSNLDLPDGRKNLRLWEEQRLTTWFEPYMPSLDHSQPHVAEASADSAIWWLENYGVDAFRHDATKHIEIEFWRLLTRKIRTEFKQPVYQIGETFGNRELIGSYVGTGLLDAQFDFNTYFDARNILAMDEGKFTDLSKSLHYTFDYYGYHHLMGNITGNHDLARFISYAGKALKWDEDDKEAGWERDIKVEDPAGYKKLSMLHAFIMTIPGIPIVYYGDDIGMAGAGDPDNRRMMDFEKMGPNEITVRNTLKRLTRLRAEHMALLFGDFRELAVTDATWVYSRHYLNDHILIVMNKSDRREDFSIPLTDKLLRQNWQPAFDSPFENKNNTLNLSLPAHSFEIFVAR